MNKDTRPLWQKYLLAFGIGFLIALVALLLNGAFRAGEADARMKAFSDAFLLPGVLFLLIGGLSWVASKGFCDLIGFSTTSLLGFFIPRGEDSDRGKAANLYEYKKAKDEKGRYWLPHVLVAGIFFLAVSVLFALLFHRAA